MTIICLATDSGEMMVKINLMIKNKLMIIMMVFVCCPIFKDKTAYFIGRCY